MSIPESLFALNTPIPNTENTFSAHISRRAPLPVANPTLSYWLTAKPSPLARTGADGPLPAEVDVAVIGSGMTGTNVALQLALRAKESGRALTVAVFEARDFCSGATGRNGGHLTGTSFLEFAARSALHGPSEALRMAFFEDRVVSSVLSLIKEHGWEDDVDLVQGGNLHLFANDEEERLARLDYDAATIGGWEGEVEWLDKKAVEERLKTKDVYSAVRISGNNLYPLLLCTKVLQHGQSLLPTLSLYTHTPVTSFTPLPASSPSNARYTLSTPRGTVRARTVVHATNAYVSHLLPHVPVVPTRGQVVAVRAPDTHWTAGLSAREGFEYLFQRPDRGPIILGGGRESVVPGHEYGVADDSELSELAGRTLRGFLPGTFEGRFEVEQEWTGIMGFTKSKDPLVGPVISPSGELVPGQYVSAGYSGHGMPRATGCAEVVAGMAFAELTGTHSELPEWIPRTYLTTQEGKKDKNERSGSYCTLQ